MRTRRFLVAVLVSLLLHVVVISAAWLRIPDTRPVLPPLEARLERVAHPPAPAAEPPKPRTNPRPAQPRRAALPVPAVAAASPIALPPEPEPPAPVAEAPEPAPSTAEEPPAIVATAPSSTFVPEPAPVRSLPRRGRITYTLFLGTDQFSIGKTVQSWEVDGDNYKLGSMSETTGIADLFRSQRLVYLSGGRVTARGLQPENFLMSRTRRGQTEEAQAQFDWAAGRITLGNAPNQRDAALPADTQDLVSFMYQLALAPPAPGRIRLPITNGSRLETYEIDVLNEEQIETPLGMIKALPVKQVRRPGVESIEIWLAIDYRHLPVKIRFLDREGNPSGEQIVNEIRISEE